MSAFDQSTADLAAMVEAVGVADQKLAADSAALAAAIAQVPWNALSPLALWQSAQAATGGNFADAITAYQAAGAQAVAKLGPEMDAAGAANATQPYTQEAWNLNGQLAAVPTQSGSFAAGNEAAQSASTLVRAMIGLYDQGITAGQAALASPAPPAPAPAPAPPAGPPQPPPSGAGLASAALLWKAILVAYGQLHPGAEAPAALSYALGQAMGEGSLTGYFRGCNNFGAMHAGSSFAQTHRTQPGYGMVAFLDHFDATHPYISRMAVYPSLAAGANAFLSLIEAMLTLESVTSVQDYAAKLYAKNYYSGFATPRTPQPQRLAAYAAGTLTPADQANIGGYAALITRNLPAVQAAIAAAAGVTSDPTVASSGSFAPLADRLTPGPAYAPHTLDHAASILGDAGASPPPGAVSLADCQSTAAGGEGIWMFGGGALPAPPSVRPQPGPSVDTSSIGAGVMASLAPAAIVLVGAAAAVLYGVKHHGARAAA